MATQPPPRTPDQADPIDPSPTEQPIYEPAEVNPVGPDIDQPGRGPDEV